MEANLTKRNGVVSMDKDFNLMCQLLRNGEYTVKMTFMIIIKPSI